MGGTKEGHRLNEKGCAGERRSALEEGSQPGL